MYRANLDEQIEEVRREVEVRRLAGSRHPIAIQHADILECALQTLIDLRAFIVRFGGQEE